MISMNTVVHVCSEQISTDVGGEVVILNLKDGVYYGLDPVGGAIWKLLQTPIAVNRILETMLREYDVDAVRCKQDLLALLGELESRGLVHAKDESTTNSFKLSGQTDDTR